MLHNSTVLYTDNLILLLAKHKIWNDYLLNLYEFWTFVQLKKVNEVILSYGLSIWITVNAVVSGCCTKVLIMIELDE